MYRSAKTITSPRSSCRKLDRFYDSLSFSFKKFLNLNRLTYMQAVGLDSCEGIQEETVTDKEGQYRLRGLQVLESCIKSVVKQNILIICH